MERSVAKEQSEETFALQRNLGLESDYVATLTFNMNLSAILRAAIDGSGKSRYAIAKETGVDESVINKFMGGKDIRLETAGKLMDAVGLKVLATSKRKR